jgi:hypothetical protein
VLLVIIITQAEMSEDKQDRVKRFMERSVSAGVRLWLAVGWGTFFSFEGDTRPGAAGYDVGGWVGII